MVDILLTTLLGLVISTQAVILRMLFRITGHLSAVEVTARNLSARLEDLERRIR